MLGLMQFFFRYFIAIPILALEEKHAGLSTIQFGLIVLSCILIAAGGYVINDIEDVGIDRINKPEKTYVGTNIKINTAYSLYLALTLTGISIGFYLSFCNGIRYVGVINLVVAGLLYFYSTSYKCIPVLGNVIVAIITALSVAIVVLPEPVMMNDGPVLVFCTGYAFFAFLMTFIRESLKDMEDLEGDHAHGCKTLPVVAGTKTVKVTAFLLTALSILIIAKIQWSTKQWDTIVPFTFITALIQLPLIWLSIQIIKAHDKKGFHACGNLSKLIMFTGIISMFAFYFSFK